MIIADSVSAGIARRWFPADRWSRLPLFWRLQIGGWTAFTIFSFPLKWVVLETVPGSVFVSFYRDGIAFLLTIAMRELYRRLYRRKIRLRWLVPMVALVSIGAGAILTLFSLAFHGLLDFHAAKVFSDEIVFGIFYFRTGLFAVWSLLYFGIKRIQDASATELRLAVAESEKREAELQMLRSQMNPHFLFNALNTIRAAVGMGAEQIAPQIDALAGYLRYSLAHRRDEFVSVEAEFNAVVDYLAVEKFRFRDQLCVECQIKDEARGVTAPGIIMQPLVGNAIKHGRETSPIPLIVRLLVSVEAGCLQIEVANTGQWIEPPPDPGMGGVGLGNLRKRLALIYGGRERVEIAEDDGWVKVVIRIPRKHSDG